MISHIVQVEGAMKEACPVLFEFELFNPEVLDKLKKGQKVLLTMLFNVYGTTIGDYQRFRQILLSPILILFM